MGPPRDNGVVSANTLFPWLLILVVVLAEGQVNDTPLAMAEDQFPGARHPQEESKG